MSNEIALKVNLDDLIQQVKDGSKLMFHPEVEEAIVKLLTLESLVAQAKEQVKQAIASTGETIMPGFNGVTGEQVRCTYQYHGEEFGIDESLLTQVPEECYEKQTKTTYKANGAQIRKFVKAYGKLPVGVYRRQRNKAIHLTLKSEVQLPQGETHELQAQSQV